MSRLVVERKEYASRQKWLKGACFSSPTDTIKVIWNGPVRLKIEIVELLRIQVRSGYRFKKKEPVKGRSRSGIERGEVKKTQAEDFV